jgi:hypothetical protein
VRTWRSLRRDDAALDWGLWCGLWIILVSATFGVVLEGPMGAVPFWIMLGLVAAQSRAEPAPAPSETTRSQEPVEALTPASATPPASLRSLAP